MRLGKRNSTRRGDKVRKVCNPNIELVVKIAMGEIGYCEKASNSQLDQPLSNVGARNYTKYARDLDAIGFYNTPKQGYDWCAVFVDWCFVKAFGMMDALSITGQTLGGCGAGCAESMRYYKNILRFSDVPIVGDQIFFKKGSAITHTGLVVGMDERSIYTVEGNTRNSTGVVPNGGGVFAKAYDKGNLSIAGYGHPMYEKIKMKVEDDMDGLQIYQKLQEYLQDEPAPDWIKEEFAEAVKMGITDGTRPCILVPTWRAAVMAKRAVEAALKEVTNGERPSDLQATGDPQEN